MWVYGVTSFSKVEFEDGTKVKAALSDWRWRSVPQQVPHQLAWLRNSLAHQLMLLVHQSRSYYLFLPGSCIHRNHAHALVSDNILPYVVMFLYYHL